MSTNDDRTGIQNSVSVDRGLDSKDFGGARGGGKTCAHFGFSRLPHYYASTTLNTAKVVIVPKVPVPPLSAMGLDRFTEFEQMNAGGITYLDTYFARTDHAHLESLHCHELVHVIQWRLLGPEKFLALYADGLEHFGYRPTPLEVMAYDLQDKFERESQPFSVEAACQMKL